MIDTDARTTSALVGVATFNDRYDIELRAGRDRGKRAGLPDQRNNEGPQGPALKGTLDKYVHNR